MLATSPADEISVRLWLLFAGTSIGSLVYFAFSASSHNGISLFGTMRKYPFPYKKNEPICAANLAQTPCL